MVKILRWPSVSVVSNRHIALRDRHLIGFQDGFPGDANLDVGIGTLQLAHIPADVLDGTAEAIEITRIGARIRQDEEQLAIIRPQKSIVGHVVNALDEQAVPW
jgi:hypothetical protein